MNKNVIVIGASPDSFKYSNKAVKKLTANNFNVYAIGSREGNIEGIKIVTTPPEVKDVYAITLYINPEIQKQYYDYIIKTSPGFVFFNPGTENDELVALAAQNNIKTIEGCTLVALSYGNF